MLPARYDDDDIENIAVIVIKNFETNQILALDNTYRLDMPLNKPTQTLAYQSNFCND